MLCWCCGQDTWFEIQHYSGNLMPTKNQLEYVKANIKWFRLTQPQKPINWAAVTALHFSTLHLETPITLGETKHETFRAMLVLAPLLRRYLTMRRWPFWELMKSGEAPSTIWQWTSALLDTSSSRTSRWLHWQATKRGVPPSWTTHRHEIKNALVSHGT